MVVANKAILNTKVVEIENKISDTISFIITPEFNKVNPFVLNASLL